MCQGGSEEACAEPAQLWRGGGRQGGDPQPGHHHPRGDCQACQRLEAASVADMYLGKKLLYVIYSPGVDNSQNNL